MGEHAYDAMPEGGSIMQVPWLFDSGATWRMCNRNDMANAQNVNPDGDGLQHMSGCPMGIISILRGPTGVR